jgi:biotin carboxyl carrier protein
MEYVAEVSGKKYAINLEDKEKVLHVGVLGKQYRADLVQIEGSEYSLLLNDHSHVLTIEGNGRDYLISDGKEAYRVTVSDERELQRESALGTKIFGQHRAIIKSSMPGIVTSIMVQKGDSVEEGTPLLIIEAMKMENEIRSTITGRVKKIFVQAGKIVANGEPLVEIG